MSNENVTSASDTEHSPDVLRCLDCGTRIHVKKKEYGTYIWECGCEWSRPADEPHMGIWVREGSEHWQDRDNDD